MLERNSKTCSPYCQECLGETFSTFMNTVYSLRPTNGKLLMEMKVVSFAFKRNLLGLPFGRL